MQIYNKYPKKKSFERNIFDYFTQTITLASLYFLLFILYDDSRLVVVLTELTWRASFFLLEDAIEVTEVIESTIEPYLTDALSCIHEHAGSIAQTKVDDIFADVPTRMQLEESTECTCTHTGKRGKLRQAKFIHVILRDIVLHL